MSYTTVDELVTKYPRLSKTNVNSAGLYKWIVAASNYVDGYISSMVAGVPVTPTPPMLQDLTEDLTFAMFLRRNVHEMGKETGIEVMWKETIDRLENIRNGTFVLLSGSGTVLSLSQRNAEPWSNTMDYTPTFGVDDIDDSETDPDRKDDEEDAR